MPEQTQDQANTQAQDAPKDETIQQQVPVLTEAKIQEVISKEIAKAQAAQPKGKELSEKDIEKLLEKQRLDIAKSISGQEDKGDGVDPALKMFAANPTEFLNRFGDHLKNTWKKEQQEEKAKTLAFDNAFVSTLEDRPDILKNKAATQVFLGFYGGISDDKSEEERFKLALDAYDVYLETQDAASAKERVEKARGLSLNTSKTSGNDAPLKKTEAQIYQDEVKEEKEAFLRSRGRL